jgi:hypothetical protein
VYANKADNVLILPICLNQVLTNEKSEKSEKAILKPSSGPQRNLKQLFFGANLIKNYCWRTLCKC